MGPLGWLSAVALAALAARDAAHHIVDVLATARVGGLVACPAVCWSAHRVLLLGEGEGEGEGESESESEGEI